MDTVWLIKLAVELNRAKEENRKITVRTRNGQGYEGTVVRVGTDHTTIGEAAMWVIIQHGAEKNLVRATAIDAVEE